MKRHIPIVQKRTTDILSNGAPKLPLPTQLLHGELAVNYAKDAETISFKNTNNEIVTIITEAQIDKKINTITNNIPDEVYIGEIVNGEPDLFVDITSNDAIDVYTKEQINIIVSDLEKELESVTRPDAGVISVNGLTGVVELDIPNSESFVTKEEFIESELTTSESLNDLNQRIVNISIPDVSNFVDKEELQTEVNTLNQRIDEISSVELPDNIVTSFNGMTGDINITIPDTNNFATKSELTNKQDKIVAGNNITITNNKTIDVIGYKYQTLPAFHSGTNCSTNYAHTYAFGDGLNASNANQHIIGLYNNNNYSHWGDKPLFIIGSGSSDSRRSILISQKDSGNLLIAGNLQQNNGCDFAEYFEWADGNPDNEDRVGYMVTTDGEKLILSPTIDECIGVVTGTGAFIGDAASVEWKDRYLRDEWGRILTEEINGEIKQIENPAYDPTLEYIPRMYRKEWSPVGLVGRIYTRQDGTLKVNGYATCKNGIATQSDKGYRVLKIVNENIAMLLIK